MTPIATEKMLGKEPGILFKMAFKIPMAMNNGPCQARTKSSSEEKEPIDRDRSLFRAPLMVFPVVCPHIRAQHKQYTELALDEPIASTSFAYSLVSTSATRPRAKQKAFAKATGGSDVSILDSAGLLRKRNSSPCKPVQ